MSAAAAGRCVERFALVTNAEPWRRRGLGLLATVGVIWIVSLYGLLVDERLQFALAVQPRKAEGLIGVLGMPFVHGSMTHLFANTVPMLIFGGILMVRGVGYFFKVSLAITVLGGAALWLIGRDSAHIGASGVVFGYFGFLVLRGLYERRLSSLGAALFVIVLYGGMIFGVLPREDHISWEAHLVGLLAGGFWARVAHALDRRVAARERPNDGGTIPRRS